MTEKIGLIGLGLVGSALVERLSNAGFHVIGHDTRDEASAPLQQYNLSRADSPQEVAQQAHRILLSLPNTDIVTQVVEGKQGITTVAGSEHIIIDTTTGDPVRSVQLAERLAHRGIQYLDATIMGSSQQVRTRDVVLLVGGAAEIIEAQQDIFDSFAPTVVRMGAIGKGMQAKLIANLVIGLNRLVLAEGLSLGIHAGMEPNAVLQMLQAGMAYSKVMDSKGPKMIHRDFEPIGRLRQHQKDVGLILELGQRVGCPLPLSELHAAILEDAVKHGYGDLDNSAVIKMFMQSPDDTVTLVPSTRKDVQEED